MPFWESRETREARRDRNRGTIHYNPPAERIRPLFNETYYVGRPVKTSHDATMEEYGRRIAPIYYIKEGRYDEAGFRMYRLQTAEGHDVPGCRYDTGGWSNAGWYKIDDLELVPIEVGRTPSYDSKEKEHRSDRQDGQDRDGRGQPPPYRQSVY